jgi:Xaa-Pro aminopeptidase
LLDNDFAGFLVTALDEVAWLFNLRGSDISFNPLFFSYALITTSNATLYLFKDRLPKTGLSELSTVCLKEYNEVFEDVKLFTKSQAGGKQKLLVSPSCNAALVMAAGGAEAVVIKSSPVEIAKAIKNETEIEGFRQCHIRDAAALANYFCWLEKELQDGKVIDEVDGAERLEQYRRAQKDCVGLSFDTISGSGPNGAIIHYKPEKPSAANITMDQLYLCDSGGQYLYIWQKISFLIIYNFRDGTTDVTRTFHFGNPSAEEKDRFTRVLKGNIALNRAIFPVGTTGFMLDILARQYLWTAGLDYRHGTGHGVGHYLNVHEGPQNISFRSSANEIPLKPGMTVTDEPGYYEDSKFGIRIENVLLVAEAKTECNFGNIGFLTFENITMFPIQKKLIDVKLLNKEEIDYLNDYHNKVWEKVSPLLESEAKKWLRKETLPI